MKSSSGYEIYHSTLSSVLDEIERYVQSKGYEVGDYFPLINHVSYGTTEKTDLELLKNGKLANNLKIQIYRMESGKYELNCYPVRNFQKGNIVDKFAGGGKVLWGVKKGDADWKEQIITENEQQNENAKKWAIANGFDRFRIQMIDLSTPPDFKKTFKNGGGIESVKVGNKYHYKFDNKNYEVLAIENSKVVIAPIPLGSFWNNREISFSLMNKWIIEKTMVKI
jgi:hypothetical protein